jgi:hypothetical protein
MPAHPRTRGALAGAIALTVLLLTGDVAHAQPRPQRPPIRPAFDTEIQRLDDEISRLVLSRAGMPAPDAARLDLRVDLRILQRWALQAATEQDDWSEPQAAFYCRARVWQNAVAWADKTFGAGAGGSGGGALPATVTAWHTATFKLKAPKTLAEADAQSKDAAVALIPVMKSLPGGFDAKPMRPPVPHLPPPKSPPQDDTPDTSPETPAKPATLAEMAQRVRALAVSADLRKQLVQLAEAAQAAAVGGAAGGAGGGEDKEAAALRDGLVSSLQVAEGLASNLAVTPDARAKLEADLAAAVALYPDPRLRDRAKARLATITPYARFLSRVASLKLSEDQLRRFAPTIAYARSAPDGAAALASIESFLKTAADFDAKYASGKANPALPANLRTASEAAIKSFSAHRTTFLDTASRGPDTADTLVRNAGEMRYQYDLLLLLEELPKIQDTLSNLKTKPPAGIDRRIAQSIPVVTSQEPSPERTAARQYLDDVQLLSQAVLSSQSPIALKPEVAKLLLTTGITPEKLEAKRKSTLLEQASALAGAKDAAFDRSRLNRLLHLGDLLDIATDLAAFQADLAATDITGKWVDLSPPLASRQSSASASQEPAYRTDSVLSQLYSPFATPVLSLFQAYLDDNADTFDRHPRVHQRLQVATRFAQHLAEASKTTVSFPEGELLLAQQLLTPLDRAPFNHERLLTLIAFALPNEDEIPEVLLGDLLRKK